MEPEKLLLKPREVVAILGVRRETLYRWRKNGIIRYVTLPSGDTRYPRSEIERILKGNK
jgi:predicted site-specific integrase-resolvase